MPRPVRSCGIDEMSQVASSRSSFHTTSVSPVHNAFRQLVKPGRSCMPDCLVIKDVLDRPRRQSGHCCKVSDEAAFCLIQRPYISKTLLTRRISPRGSP
jgi:hypothetical protein